MKLRVDATTVDEAVVVIGVGDVVVNTSNDSESFMIINNNV